MRKKPSAYAVDVRNGVVDPNTNGTLQSKPNGGISLNMNNVVLVLNDMGGAVIEIEKTEISPTLRSHSKHHEPIVCFQPGMAVRWGGHCYKEQSPTLQADGLGDNFPCIVSQK